MLRLSNNYLFLLIFLSISFASFSKTDSAEFNTVFRDSVLKNKIDSSNWKKLAMKLDIHKSADNFIFIQNQKQPTKSHVFFVISIVILLLLLLLRLIFDDFSFSLLEGIANVKKFIIFYKSKKYDSPVAIFFIYFLKIAILSLVLYLALHFIRKDNFSFFDYSYFLETWMLLGLFFLVKNITEFFFNWVINTQEFFKSFFLLNLFAEFLFSMVLLVLFLVYIYNSYVSYDFMVFLIAVNTGIYVVFNIARSYQLMGNIKIPYKLHFFLYLCAFKIIPLLLLAKYILKNIVE